VLRKFGQLSWVEIGYWFGQTVFDFREGQICFDKSHVPAVGSNQLHNAVVDPGRGAFLWTYSDQCMKVAVNLHLVMRSRMLDDTCPLAMLNP